MATNVLGLLLAAGEGRRMGRPKALLREADGTPYVTRAVGQLQDAGCDPVLVVVGAAAEDVTALLPADEVEVVEAADWAEGMGASLRAGLAAAGSHEAAAALVTLVDLPDLDARVHRRVVAAASAAGPPARALARATFDGAAGHPVLLGRDHWAGVQDAAGGDRGARDYLARRAPLLVECGDLASGSDVDTPEQLPGPR